jgi:hypothetical protein
MNYTQHRNFPPISDSEESSDAISEAPTCTCEVWLDATGHGGLGMVKDGACVAISPDEVRTDCDCVGHPENGVGTDWELFCFVVMVRRYGRYMHMAGMWSSNQIARPLSDGAPRPPAHDLRRCSAPWASTPIPGILHCIAFAMRSKGMLPL